MENKYVNFKRYKKAVRDNDVYMSDETFNMI